MEAMQATIVWIVGGLVVAGLYEGAKAFFEAIMKVAKALEDIKGYLEGYEAKFKDLQDAMKGFKDLQQTVQGMKDLHERVIEAMEAYAPKFKKRLWSIYDRCDKVGNKAEVMERRMEGLVVEEGDLRRHLRQCVEEYRSELGGHL